MSCSDFESGQSDLEDDTPTGLARQLISKHETLASKANDDPVDIDALLSRLENHGENLLEEDNDNDGLSTSTGVAATEGSSEGSINQTQGDDDVSSILKDSADGEESGGKATLSDLNITDKKEKEAVIDDPGTPTSINDAKIQREIRVESNKEKENILNSVEEVALVPELEVSSNKSNEEKEKEDSKSPFVFDKKVPLGPNETWDFSLEGVVPNYESKCLWIEGSVYQKLSGECLHEMQIVLCPCNQKMKFTVCRLCHTQFCSSSCFKQALKAQIGSTRHKSKVETTSASSLTRASKSVNLTKTDELQKSCNTTEPEPFRKTDAEAPKMASHNDDASKSIEYQKETKVSGSDSRLRSKQRQKSTLNADFKKQFPGQNQNNYKTYNNLNVKSQQNQAGISMPPVSMYSTIPTQVIRQHTAGAGLLGPPPSSLTGYSSQSHPLQLVNDSHPQLRTAFDANFASQQQQLQVAANKGQQIMKMLSNGPMSNQPNQQKNSYPNNIGNTINHSTATTASGNAGATANFSNPKATSDNRPAPERVHRNPYGAHAGISEKQQHEIQQGDTARNSRLQSNPVGQREQRSMNVFNNQNGVQDANRGKESLQNKATHNNNGNNFRKEYGNSFDQNRGNNGKNQHKHADGSRRDQHKQNANTNKKHGVNAQNFKAQDNHSFVNSGDGAYFNRKHNATGGNNGQDRNSNVTCPNQQNKGKVSGKSSMENVEVEGSTRKSWSDQRPPNGVSNNRRRAAQFDDKNQSSRNDNSSSSYSADSSSQTSFKTAKSSQSSSVTESYQRTGPPRRQGDCADLITGEPDFPVGISIQAKHVRGNNFYDFVVVPMSSEYDKTMGEINEILRDCPKNIISPPRLGEFCIVKHSVEFVVEEWHRAEITKYFSKKIGVYLLDLGIMTFVDPKAVYELPIVLSHYRPTAVKFKCLNIKANSTDLDVCDYFSRLVEGKTVKIRITHKVEQDNFLFAGYLEVSHLGKWWSVGTILQKFQVAEDVPEHSISYNGLTSIIKPIPVNNLPCSDTSTVEAEIIYADSPNEFYIATKESMKRKFIIETQLNSEDALARCKPVKTLQDLSSPLFALLCGDDDTQTRVKILEVSDVNGVASAKVQKIDYGEVLADEVPITDLKKLPDELIKPSCVYRCSLPVKLAPKSRNKTTPVKYEELTNYLTGLYEQKAKFVVYSIEDEVVHVVELFIGDSKEGCANFFINKGWAALTHEVNLNCLRKS